MQSFPVDFVLNPIQIRNMVLRSIGEKFKEQDREDFLQNMLKDQPTFAAYVRGRLQSFGLSSANSPVDFVEPVDVKTSQLEPNMTLPYWEKRVEYKLRSLVTGV